MEPAARRRSRLHGGAGCGLEWAARRSRLRGKEAELGVGWSRRGGGEVEQTVRLFSGGGL